MGSPGAAQLISLFLVAIVVAALCGFRAATVAHPKKHKHLRVGIAATLSTLTALAAVAGLGAPTAVAATKCRDIEIVFARGTDEPAGIGAVGKALVDSLESMVTDQSIGIYAVKYPASWDFTQVAAGANDASKHIQSIAATCPDSKIVLGGYSQGAAVMDVVTTSPIAGLGYTTPLPAAVVPHIAAVVVFGNPSARLGRPLTSLSPDFGARTADLCNTNDPICSRGEDFDSHTSYPQSGLVKLAAQWITKHVTQSESSTANP